MIGRLQGLLLDVVDGDVLLDVHGIGYEIEVPLSTLAQLPERGQVLVLHTHLVIREDAHHLFGFYDVADRDLFRLLIKVNGVGPRLALGLLSGMSSKQLVTCVINNEVSALVRMPGIGKKTAERLLIELRDKLKGWEVESVLTAAAASGKQKSASAPLEEAEQALLSLGYKPQEASRAVLSALAQLEQGEGTKTVGAEQIIRTALRNLARGNG